MIGTMRPVNLGALALVMTYIVGTLFVHEAPREMLSGFPVDLLMLLVGVTWLFGIASTNGTVEHIVEGSAGLVRNARAWLPWIVFVVASLPAMAGALGSAGVAILAPLSLRLAERHEIDRRMMGLMVIHGAGAGNFSPLNVLSGIVVKAIEESGLQMSVSALFLANLAYNLLLALVIYIVFGGLSLRKPLPVARAVSEVRPQWQGARWGIEKTCTVLSVFLVALLAFGFELNIGFLALSAAVVLQLVFPASSDDAEKKIAWKVVLLVCGIVTYVAALQRYGTVTAVGDSLAQLSTPLVIALLLCFVGAVTSAFASSAGILGAMIPLAIPFMAGGEIGTTGMVIALAISATAVDSTPFSTVGALVVANAADAERNRVYRGLLLWGGVMVLTAPLITWMVFVVLGVGM